MEDYTVNDDEVLEQTWSSYFNEWLSTGLFMNIRIDYIDLSSWVVLINSEQHKTCNESFITN